MKTDNESTQGLRVIESLSREEYLEKQKRRQVCKNRDGDGKDKKG